MGWFMLGATKLREMMGKDSMILAPFTYDAFTAKIGESVGFQCIYMSGFGTAMSKAYPDVGLLTQTEMVQNAREIVNAVSVPVIADADTGYGNPINTWRTVREYEAAGVAGIHIEDQVFPKKCGFFEGKQVIPLEEAVQKIRAALDARVNPDFVIIARCDALAVNGWEDTIIRCKAYSEAGADAVFIDGIKTTEDLKVYADRLHNISRVYNGDLLPANEVAKMGYKIMLHRGPMFALFRFIRDLMQELKDTGNIDPTHIGNSVDLRKEIASLLELNKIYEMEQRYTNS